MPSDNQPSCPQCKIPLERGIATGQTVNKLRPGQTIGTIYPCGPGYLMACLKCPGCGFSITTKE